jgi:hypothetical protein
MTTPTITAPVMTGKKNNQIKVALKVKDLKNIHAITLRLEYFKSVLTFKKAEANKSMMVCSTPIIHATEVDDEMMKIKIVWSSVKPLSLKNNQVLAYLYFKCSKEAGVTTLFWNNLASNGFECVFTTFTNIPSPLPDGPGNFVDGKVTVK